MFTPSGITASTETSPTFDATEAEWSDYLSRLMPESEREHQLFDGTRIDIYFPIGNARYAIEVERGMKWHEGVGQAAWYGVATNAHPVALLLVKDDIVESRYIYRAMLTGQRANVSIWAYNIVENRWTANYNFPVLK